MTVPLFSAHIALEKYIGTAGLKPFIDADLVLERMVSFRLPEMTTTALPPWCYTVASTTPTPRRVRVPTPFFRRIPTWWPK